MKAILVVCEGNICRSPMAQGLLQAALPQLRVESAGLGALVGHPADDQAQALMRERGIDISAHRARQITRQLCLESDVVLVMESDQRQRLVEMYPQASGRVFRIGEHAKRDVPDPYRQGPAAFRDSLAMIEEGAGHWLERIRQLN
jgi:protein-tyrosine phosphatase